MAKEANGVEYNSIAHGSKIIGKVILDKNFRVDGEIEGEIITTGKVIIGKKGHLKGEARCASADISGKVDGKVIATESFTLRETGILTGEIITKTLIIESKAIFNGSCSMNNDDLDHQLEKGNGVNKKELIASK